MDNPETKSSTGTSVEQLQDQLDSLRHIVVSMLILSIVVSGTFTLFLLRQSKYARTEAASMRGSINEFNSTNLPVIKDFRERLAIYSQSHSDFAPIARKYGISPTQMPAAQSPAAAVPASAVSPAGAPKQKK
jgi:hypothetical protein